MKKKQFRYRGCRVKLKETQLYTDLEIILPNNDKYGKRFVDKRPCKEVSMLDNECFEAQIHREIDELLKESVIDHEQIH